MNRILTATATLLGAGWLIMGCGNRKAEENKSKEWESTIDTCWQLEADLLLRNAILGNKRIKGACIAGMIREEFPGWRNTPD